MSHIDPKKPTIGYTFTRGGITVDLLDFDAPSRQSDMAKTNTAGVAELADALDSGSSVLTDVEVQILSPAL